GEGSADIDMSDVDGSDKQPPTAKIRRHGSDDDDWVLYAYHPRYGPFQMHKGVDVVVDRFLVSGLSRIGYQSITLDAKERYMVRQLAAHPWWYDEPMHFPVMDALCPVIWKIGRAIFSGAIQPATDPIPDPFYPAAASAG
ncbi:hypothetical protein MKW98_024057, partial [Papaver atlanticum]